MVRTYVRTPAGALGAIAILLSLTIVFIVVFGQIRDSSRDAKTQCYIEQAVQPWIGLRKTFSAPVGDVEARDAARKAITRGIERVEHLDDYC